MRVGTHVEETLASSRAHALGALIFLVINGVSAFFFCLSDLFISENMHKDETKGEAISKSLKSLQGMGFAESILSMLNTNTAVSVLPTSHFLTHCSLNTLIFCVF